MKKVKVIIKEWECKEVEYICEVDDTIREMDGGTLSDCDEWNTYGIGFLDGGDLGTDAMGFDAITISKKVLDEEYDSKWDVVEWSEIKENK